MTALAAATLVSLLRADDPYSFFMGGRYAEPVGYLNANCALFLAAFWPAAFLASRRETPWWLRGLFLASAAATGTALMLLRPASRRISRAARFWISIRPGARRPSRRPSTRSPTR